MRRLRQQSVAAGERGPRQASQTLAGPVGRATRQEFGCNTENFCAKPLHDDSIAAREGKSSSPMRVGGGRGFVDREGSGPVMTVDMPSTDSHRSVRDAVIERDYAEHRP